jgi:lipoate-protein ligase A
MSSPVFRLILDPPRQAALNMAIDEMLVLSQASAGSGPVLRLYGWEEPSITAGYFQKIDHVAKKFDAYRKGIPVARPVPSPFFSSDVKSSYLRINEAVRKGLERGYPEIDYADCRTVPAAKGRPKERICFDSPACYDLLLHGKKILGSSQRRIGKNLLHQATLFLDADRDHLAREIVKGFGSVWKVSFKEEPLTEEELAAARRIEETRYASSDWALLRERSFFS